MSGEWDVIINVIDASQLARSLELTLELKDLEAPMVVCLNMMDEAVRKGILIDSKALSTALGVPVVETIAARGQGILDSFRAALSLSRQPRRFIPNRSFMRRRSKHTVGAASAQALAVAMQGDRRLGTGNGLGRGWVRWLLPSERSEESRPAHTLAE